MRTFSTAALLFFATGALGLAYELVWIRKATLIVGASQIALSTVVCAFFLGLGIGSWLVGRRLPGTRLSPLVLYGLFELGIGAFALAFPALFRALERAYGALYPLLEGSGPAVFGLRFLLLLALFLPPTVLMGGDLPLLLDGLVREDATVGAKTSLLYGINILGAVAGVLIASYVTIPELGLDGTSMAAAAGNFTIGLAAVALFRGGATGEQPLASQPRAPPTIGFFFTAASFASGFLALAYQSAWARYFSLFNTGTVYLTAILLAVYLLALATGSLLLAPLLRRRFDPLRTLAATQGAIPPIAIACLGWWSLADYRFAIRGATSPEGQIEAIDTLELDYGYAEFWRFASETADAIFFAPFFQVALVIFLPVVLIGTGLPSLIAARARAANELRSVSGRLIFWNTLGSSAAGFATGYLLLPLAGLHGTFVALGAMSLAFSITIWMRSLGTADTLSPAAVAWGILPVSGTLALLILGFGEDLTRRTIRTAGYGRDPEILALHEDGASRGRDPLLDIVEGPLTTSFVIDTPRNIRIGSGNVCLAVAWKEGVSTQVIQGHIPGLFYPGAEGPRDCLGICLGSGQSFGALLLHGIRRLDVVDISSEIIDLSLEHFAPYNHGLEKDPRVRIHLDDGRHFVERAASESYDVISMEPPPPAADGVYALYSREFYEETARVLRPDGVFMQWLPLYRVTPLDARSIVKTQRAVFPETFIFKVGDADFMVVSYRTRPVFLLESIEARLAAFRRERHIAGARWGKRCRFEVASREGVLSLLIAGPETLGKLDAPFIYDDDRQTLSYSSGDRGLLRRYQGQVLSPLAFSALELTPFEELSAYFEPRLTADMAAALDEERAASLESFRVPSPAALRKLRQDAAEAPPGLARAGIHLKVAEAVDATLRKDEAFGAILMAMEALQGAREPIPPEHLETVRAIVRHALAANVEVTERWLAELGTKHPGSPLYAAMNAEYSDFEEREEERRRGYWWE